MIAKAPYNPRPVDPITSLDELTGRQRDLVYLAVDGVTKYSAQARALGVEYHTVRNMWSGIRSRTHCPSVVAVVVWAWPMVMAERAAAQRAARRAYLQTHNARRLDDAHASNLPAQPV